MLYLTREHLCGLNLQKKWTLFHPFWLGFQKPVLYCRVVVFHILPISKTTYRKPTSGFKYRLQPSKTLSTPGHSLFSALKGLAVEQTFCYFTSILIRILGASQLCDFTLRRETDFRTICWWQFTFPSPSAVGVMFLKSWFMMTGGAKVRKKYTKGGQFKQKSGETNESSPQTVTADNLWAAW